MTKVYVAGSWKRHNLDLLHERLRVMGYKTLDPRTWHTDDDTSQSIADKDLSALSSADLVVLALPAGTSSLLEAGLAMGQRSFESLEVWGVVMDGSSIAEMVAEDPMLLWLDKLVMLEELNAD